MEGRTPCAGEMERTWGREGRLVKGKGFSPGGKGYRLAEIRKCWYARPAVCHPAASPLMHPQAIQLTDASIHRRTACVCALTH